MSVVIWVLSDIHETILNTVWLAKTQTYFLWAVNNFLSFLLCQNCWNSHTGIFFNLIKNIILGEEDILEKKRNLINLSISFTFPLFPVHQKVQPGTRNVLISVKCLNLSNQQAWIKKVLWSPTCSRDKVSAATSLPTKSPSAINLLQLRTGRTIYTVQQEEM